MSCTYDTSLTSVSCYLPYFIFRLIIGVTAGRTSGLLRPTRPTLSSSLASLPLATPSRSTRTPTTASTDRVFPTPYSTSFRKLSTRQRATYSRKGSRFQFVTPLRFFELESSCDLAKTRDTAKCDLIYQFILISIFIMNLDSQC